MANCLNRRDQMVYSIFFKIVPLGAPRFFLFRRSHSERECLLRLPTMTTNSFRIPVVQKLRTFSPIFFHWDLFSPFLKASTKFMMTKVSKTSLFISCKCWHPSSVYIYQKAHSQMRTFMIKRQTRIAPSWSLILMLLMTTNKFSEFGRICIDQGLDLVFESRAILCGMPFKSSVECPLTPPWYSHLALISYPFGYGGLLGLTGMTEIPWFWTSMGSNSL